MKFYLVGGAVRDMVLGKEPQDRDWVVVGSSPEEMLALGYEQVGADFPVFLHPVSREEYALARQEYKDGSGYLGFKCTFGKEVTLEQDLERRDLTCNSMAYDPDTGEFIDIFGSVNDIKSGIIRHTSDAFSEDPLRVLRALRFGFQDWAVEIHPSTVEKMIQIVDSGELSTIHSERIIKEMEKVFEQVDRIEEFLIFAHKIGVLQQFFPKLEPSKLKGVGWSSDIENCFAIMFSKLWEDDIIFTAKSLGVGQKTMEFWVGVQRLSHGFRQVFSMKSQQIYDIMKSVDAFRRHERFFAMVDCVIAMTGETHHGRAWKRMLREANESTKGIVFESKDQIKVAVLEARMAAINDELGRMLRGRL